MVVLVILGLTSALVLPRLPSIYERFQDKSQVELLHQSLATLPLRAHSQQRDLILTTDTAKALLAPEDAALVREWKIEIPQPIIYRANGLCIGGKLNYRIKGLSGSLQLKPPYCETVSS